MNMCSIALSMVSGRLALVTLPLLVVGVLLSANDAVAADCSDFGWSYHDSDAGSGGCWVMCDFPNDGYVLVWCPICDWSYESYSFTCGPGTSYCPDDCVWHPFYNYTEWNNDCSYPVQCPYGSIGYEHYWLDEGGPQKCYVCPLLLP